MWQTARSGTLEFLDGETYLRLLIERVIDDVGRQQAQDERVLRTPVAEFQRASAALVAAQVVDRDTAEALRVDLMLALALRFPSTPGGLEPHHLSRWHGPGPWAGAVGAPAPGKPMRRTVRGCRADVETPDGVLHIHFVVLSDDRAELFATADAPGGPPGGTPTATTASASAGGPPGALGVVNIHRRVWTRNASFGSGPAGPGSSSGGPTWRGSFAPYGPPPLRPGRAVPPSQTPPMPARGGMPVGRAGPMRDLDRVRVTDDRGNVYRVAGGSGGGGGARWSFSTHLDAEDGPVATALIGVALPRLGEREVWLDAITSDSDSWEVHTFVRPGSGGAGPGQFGMNEPSLTAVDDLGGFYTSSIGRGGGGSDGLSIALRFVPRLNPRARELTLFSTGSNRRVRVIVPLPKPWGGPT